MSTTLRTLLSPFKLTCPEPIYEEPAFLESTKEQVLASVALEVGIGPGAGCVFCLPVLVETVSASCESGVAAVFRFASGVGWLLSVCDDFPDSRIQPAQVRNFLFIDQADGAA
jgi:hypothetical protein